MGRKIMADLKERIIDVQDLTLSYGRDLVLDKMSLFVDSGEWVLITGPSGCGKSTLARTISGLIPHNIPAKVEGTVRVGGMDLLESSLPEISESVGLVFQNPGVQLFHLTVAEEVAFGPRNAGLEEHEVDDRVDWALCQVGIRSLRNERPDRLSGGQKQLVAIAAVLAVKPKILVLDEPTASLDLKSTERVIEALGKVNRELGMTIVMVEHRLHRVWERVDRLYLMDRGCMVAEGPPEEVFADPARRKSYGLRRLKEQPMSSWKNLIAENGKRETGGTPLLELKEITAGYKGKKVIDRLNLEVYPGDFLALVGENGAGKSTLALVAAGLIKPQVGEVIYNGGEKPRPGLDVALLFQNPAEQLFADTVEEEVAFAPRNYDCFRKERHERVLRETGLESMAGLSPTKLSLGQQLRTALAACVSITPRVVILDEPTLGQDWGHLSVLMDYLKELNDQGTAVMLISHDYKLVHRYAHQVILIEEGQITMTGKFRRQKQERRTR